MTAANFNSAAGVIVGKIAFLSPQLAYSYLRVDYGSGSIPSGAYFVPLAAINAIAAAQVGLSPSEFNNLTSSRKRELQNRVIAKYPISGGWGGSKIEYSVFTNYTQSSSFRNVLDSQKKSSLGLTYAGANVSAELLVGFIPEWGNGTSSSNITAKQTAVSKMGWSHDRTVEHAKAIRREKPQSIRTVFDNMIKHRNNGLSTTATIRKLI